VITADLNTRGEYFQFYTYSEGLPV